MSGIQAIRTALKARAETITGVRTADELPGAATVTGNAIGVVVSYGGTQYMTDFAGNAVRTFTVTALAGLVSDRTAIAKLDALCDLTGATSMYTALNGPITSVAHDVRVVSDSGYSTYTVGSGAEAADYLGVEFTVEVGV